MLLDGEPQRLYLACLELDLALAIIFAAVTTVYESATFIKTGEIVINGESRLKNSLIVQMGMRRVNKAQPPNPGRGSHKTQMLPLYSYSGWRLA